MCGGNVKHRINFGQPHSKTVGKILLYENHATFKFLYPDKNIYLP